MCITQVRVYKVSAPRLVWDFALHNGSTLSHRCGPLCYLVRNVINADKKLAVYRCFKRCVQDDRFAGAKEGCSRDYTQHSAPALTFQACSRNPRDEMAL